MTPHKSQVTQTQQLKREELHHEKVRSHFENLQSAIKRYKQTYETSSEHKGQREGTKQGEKEDIKEVY